MAEHNLFLGTARKSVGDVTLMRRAGRQLARVRLRTISNPKTEAQAIQRNFVAPVARFYAPLRKVLARSFEGLNKDQSYNRFQKVNVDLARKEQWFLPKGTPWHPLPYKLSQGSLPAFIYSMSTLVEPYPFTWNISGWTVDDDTIGKLSLKLSNIGVRTGDVITVILVRIDSNGDFRPESFQFYVNPLSEVRIDDILPQGVLYNGVNNKISFIGEPDFIVAGAILLARHQNGEWKRSTQFLECANDIVGSLVSQEARDAAIASYQSPNSDDGGGVYPGGDDNLFNVAAMDGRALLFVGGQYTAQTDGRAGEKIILLKPDNFDRYYFVKLGTDRYLGTNSAGSLSPSDWRGVAGTPAPADNSNTIEAPAGSQMAAYLASIGWVDQ